MQDMINYIHKGLEKAKYFFSEREKNNNSKNSKNLFFRLKLIGTAVRSKSRLLNFQKLPIYVNV